MKTLYYSLARNTIKWFVFKPLYRVECLLSCGKLYKKHFSDKPNKPFRFISKWNYKLAKLINFYGL